MYFDLTPDQAAIRDAIRQFVDQEVAPKAAHHDRTGEFPRATFQALGQLGYLNMHLPVEYAGGGSDWISYAIVIEELARGCAATAVIYEAHCSLHSEAIALFGTEEQRRRWLPLLSSGDRVGAYALTEPEAGSNAAALQTRARRRGDHYVLNGQKSFITNGGVAGQYIIFATLDPSLGTRGITAFVVESDTPGFSWGAPEAKLGIHASQTTSLYLEDCAVPVENRLGDEGEGYKIALAILDGGRVGIAAQAVGITQAALDMAGRYAKERHAFGKAIAEHQAIAFKLADMATQLEAARLMTYRAAYLRGREGRATREISMAKLFASDVAVHQSLEAIQILGGYGYLREYQVERLLRDAKITQIYEGTNEIQRIVISRHVLSSL